MSNLLERPGRHRRRSGHGVAIAAVVAVALGSGTATWAVVSDGVRPTESVQGGGGGTTAARPTAAVSRAGPSRAPEPSVPIIYPAEGGRRWRTAAGHPVTAGKRGSLRRYRVLVEKDIEGLAVNEFADTVSEVLNDPRGWTAGGRWRMRRVGPGQPHDFTIYLATPRTRDILCGSAGDGYTSCRNGNAVVINVARWVKGVPNYGAGLTVYRQYVINHEVGHRLGQGHELCPDDGKPAPVMQQQTLGLHRCKANPWPYLGGERYAGASGEYNDPAGPPDRGNLDPGGEEPS